MVVAILAVSGLSVVAVRQVVTDTSSERAVAWFAPYIDTTLTPLHAFEDPEVTAAGSIALGFVVARPGTDSASCTPTWGGAYDLDEAATAIDLDRRIARYRGRGGKVVVSFGGAANQELAVTCRDDDALARAYRDVIDRYDSTTIDLDIEGAALADHASIVRRSRAIAKVQRDLASRGDHLSVWLTLPVAPGGLLADAVAVVDATLAAGVDLGGVNVMTMDYGGGREPSLPMGEAVLRSLSGTHRQLADAFRRAGSTLDSTEVWGRLGATPMIGVNDTLTDVFTRANGKALVDFARDRGLGRLSMWSANRDAPCPGGPDPSRVSNTCSGIAQAPLDFSRILDRVSGRALATGTGSTTKPDPASVDDPDTSPYPVWSAEGVFEAGDRVVRQRRVYVAKWWTQGDDPVAPVANLHDSPWRLVGPVLPTDRPPTTTTLPAGTYPDWDATVAYRAGDRVLRAGVAYEAAWFALGIDPAATPTADGPSPWRPLSEG